MEEELLSAVPCSSLTVESVLRVATAGGLYGLCAGPRDARKIGIEISFDLESFYTFQFINLCFVADLLRQV
jgi:hypothetical protein